MHALVSSNLSGMEYDPEGKRLRVMFRDGREYEYHGVEQIVADDLLTASSPGEYFARHIKGRYNGTRI